MEKQKDGKYETFYKTGGLREVVNYKKGILDGEWKLYHPEGNMKGGLIESQIYKNGKKCH